MLNACAAPEDTPEETYSSHKVHTPGISFKLLLAAVVVALWSSVLTAAYFRTGDGRWVRFVLHPPSLSFALPILVSHAAVSFRPREPAEAAEACEGAVVATGSPASRPSSGLTASQLLVAASATLAVALNSEAMRYDHVRVGIALFAISLCLFLAPLILRCDSVFHCIVCFSLAMAAPLAAIAGVVMALLNVSSALALNAEQLAERLHFAMQPTTWVCMVYGAVAVGAVLGSQPPEQVPHRAKVLFCALMVVIPLVADGILVVRSGDLCFLVGQVCFGMPMAATFWLVARSQGSRKQSASAKQIAHAAQVSFRACYA